MLLYISPPPSLPSLSLSPSLIRTGLGLKLLWNACRATNDRLARVHCPRFPYLHNELKRKKTKRYPLHDSARGCKSSLFCACVYVFICFLCIWILRRRCLKCRETACDGDRAVGRRREFAGRSTSTSPHLVMNIECGSGRGSSDAERPRVAAGEGLVSRPSHHPSVFQDQDQGPRLAR